MIFNSKDTKLYVCPHCNVSANISRNQNYHYTESIPHITLDNKYNPHNGLGIKTLMLGSSVEYFTCSNPGCKKVTVHVLYGTYYTHDRQTIWNKTIWERRIIPEHTYKNLPSYIPPKIQEDYKEAFLIKDLSPKSAATLARRCLQSMIRDFHKVKKSSLYDEIDAIRDKVDLGVWEAIDAIRSIGNIGAHLKADVNTIEPEIEPHEAEQLLKLIEVLFDLWYKKRHETEELTKSIKALAEEKKTKK